jgi:hypothetical protein
MNYKVIKVNQESLEFNDGVTLSSHHDTDCCEEHWLSFNDLTLEDFEGLEFDLSSDKFFSKIEGYGIELVPVMGYSVKVPGYGSNNGYYSDQLGLKISGLDEEKYFDITDCQVIEY